MKKQIVIILSIAFLFGSPVSLPAQRIELEPRGTELLEEKVENTYSDQFSTVKYRYRSSSSKEEIVDFYRKYLTERGFQESKMYPRRKDSQKIAFFYSKPKEMTILSFTTRLETFPSDYYITIITRSGDDAPQTTRTD